MRLFALLAAGLLIGTLTAADDKKDEKKVKDEEAILGTWKVEAFDFGLEKGAPAPGGQDKVRMTFKKEGKFAVSGADGAVKEGTYKMAPAVSPKTLDITGTEDGEQLGVYELDGDTLKLAISGAVAPTRPTELKADGKGVVLLTLKRVKDEDAILGTWGVTKFDNGTGTSPTDATLARMRWTFTKDGKRATVGGDGEERGDEFKIDPATKPKAIDFTVKGVVYPGVYELDGDTMTICTGQGKDRPTELKAEKDKCSLTVLKRVNDEKKDGTKDK